MAALCPGVQYGLSSQQNFSDNKDLIFVKLTDSALRAIEDFIRNQASTVEIRPPEISFDRYNLLPFHRDNSRHIQMT